MILFYTLLGYIEYPSDVAYPIKLDIRNRDGYPINSGTRSCDRVPDYFGRRKKPDPTGTRPDPNIWCPHTPNIWKISHVLAIPTASNRPSPCYFFSFYSWILWMTTKNNLPQFSDFFEIFSGSNGRNRRRMRTVIDSSEIYSIIFLVKKKIEINFIMSRALVWVAQPKQKKIIVLPTSLKWQFYLCAHFFQCFLPRFKKKILSKLL